MDRRIRSGKLEEVKMSGPVIKMTRNTSIVLYILALIAIVVGVDLLFFADRTWERLIVNLGIVLAFAAFYFRFLKYP